MKKHCMTIAACIGLSLFSALPASAQYLVVGAEQVQDWLSGSKKATLIDVRMPEEYQAGHIPGAINIPADRIKAEARRLPKGRAVPLIFYCRGEG
jgi:rhodanese-related sulfurtransferase